MLIAVYGSVLSIGTTITIQEGGSHDIILVALAALIIGYAIYGKIVDSVFGPTDRETPAIRLNDGVDFMPLPTWKVFMIQLLNIAGLGPILRLEIHTFLL